MPDSTKLYGLLLKLYPARPTLWMCAAAAAFLLVTGTTAAWSATASVMSIEPLDALRAE